jgi:sugar phosphate permease
MASGAAAVVAAFAVAVVAAIAYVGVEVRSRTPMLHLALFRISSFSTANVVGFVGQYAFVGIAIAQTLYFVQVRDDSILAMGVHLLPLMAAYVVVSSVAARIVRRAGFKATIATGLLLTAAATLLMSGQQPTSSYVGIAVLLAMFGTGAGLLLPPSTATAVVSVPHQEGGMASGTVNMFRQVGGTPGASITGTILTSSLAFTEALHLAVLIAGVASLAAAAATVAFIQSRPAALAPAS